MKRLLAVLLCLVLLLTGCSADTREFNRAQKEGTMSAYGNYVAKGYTENLAAVRDAMLALCMENEDNFKLLSVFVYHFPDDEATPAIVEQMDALRFHEFEPFTVKSLENFISKYPDNPHVPEAQAMILDIAFEEAKAGGIDGLYDFIIAEQKRMVDDRALALAQGNELVMNPHVQEARELHEQLLWEKYGTQDREDLETYLWFTMLREHEQEANERLRDMDWNIATAADTYQAYADFIENNKDSIYLEEAKARAYERCWAEATENGGNLDMLYVFRKNYPDSEHYAQTDALVEDLKWEQFWPNANVLSLLDYIENNPKSKYLKEAKSLLEERRKDVTYFENFTKDKEPTIESMETFLKYYPGHVKEKEALQIIRSLKGESLATLLKDGKISVSVTGSSITKTDVSITNNTDQAITVFIPFGTWFAAGSSSVQNMLVTKEYTLKVGAGLKKSTTVSTACMNINRAIPKSSNSFSVKEYDVDAKLTRLLQLLDEADATYNVKQAAIWIITDGASDSKLRSTLVTSSNVQVIKQSDIDKAREIVKKL